MIEYAQFYWHAPSEISRMKVFMDPEVDPMEPPVVVEEIKM